MADGTWKIVFTSKEGTATLTAGDTINVSYNKPEVDDLYVSKDKFDNELGEFTYVIFKIDNEALVDVRILVDGDEDDTIEEDLEVEKNKWYAVEFDGSSYDYDDDIDIEIVAKNKANEDVYATKKIGVDLAEDSVSSSKSNVTNDYISPVVTNGYGKMELSYELEEEADVTITIHKGKSSTGTKMIELLDVTDQESGSQTITWDGKDDDGKKLANGVYTYKIISKKSSTDTEVGYFVVGTVGDSGGSDSDDDSGSSSTGKCAGFSDVLANSTNCAAISWAKTANIFEGYEDGTFKPYQSISRTQVLKTILIATKIAVDPWNTSSIGLGFTDIVNGTWYIPYLKVAKGLGIFTGDGGKTTARPNDTVKRSEVLKFVFESLRIANGYNLGFCSSAFSDTPVSSWYFKYACAAKTYSLFTTGAVLNANLPATRSEVASVLYKLHTAGLL